MRSSFRYEILGKLGVRESRDEVRGQEIRSRQRLGEATLLGEKGRGKLKNLSGGRWETRHKGPLSCGPPLVRPIIRLIRHSRQLVTEQATSFFFSAFRFVRTQADRARIILLRVCHPPSSPPRRRGSCRRRVLSTARDSASIVSGNYRYYTQRYIEQHCGQLNDVPKAPKRRRYIDMWRDRYRRRVVISTLRKSCDTHAVVTARIEINWSGLSM